MPDGVYQRVHPDYGENNYLIVFMHLITGAGRPDTGSDGPEGALQTNLGVDLHEFKTTEMPEGDCRHRLRLLLGKYIDLERFP